MQSTIRSKFTLPRTLAFTGVALLIASSAHAQYTFGPQVRRAGTTQTIAFSSSSGTFQYTDSATTMEDVSYLPLTGSGAALITTAHDWTVSIAVNLSSRQMTVVSGKSAHVDMGLVLLTSSSTALVVLAAQENNTGGGDDSLYPDGWFGTSAIVQAVQGGTHQSVTPLGGAQASPNGSSYLALSGSTDLPGSAEAFGSVAGVVTLHYDASTNTVTAFFNNAPVGSYSLAGWGAKPPLTLGVWGGSGSSVAVSSGTDSGNAFSIQAPASGSGAQSNVLTVNISLPGGGTVTPNLNGKLLRLGSTNSMTAKANPGFVFTNWTAIPGGVLTNGTTLRFVMASNLVLTANFNDALAPTITITSPKSGLAGTNPFVTVSGTAKDNVGVASVQFQVNGGIWQPASGTSNWTAHAGLSPGTNVIKVFASDAAGHHSTTNSVTSIYQVSAVLIVGIDSPGYGTVTPADNGKSLIIGSRVTLTAMANPGFRFLYWGGSFMTNKAALTFTMASNLNFVAHFQDTNRPLNVITVPAVNQRWSNSVINIAGGAKDNVGVAAVYVQVNGGGWVSAVSANGFTNWVATNQMVIVGTNIVQSYATDGAGNNSVTNTVKFIGVLPPSGDWAPDSLNGLIATITPQPGSPFSLAFGVSGFSQTDTATTDDSGVGMYQYLKSSSNSATLTFSFTSPPDQVTLGTQTVPLIFTGPGSGVFNNQFNGTSGSFTTQATPSLAPASLSGHTLTAHSTLSSHTTTVKFGSTTLSGSTGSGQSVSANYTKTVASPVVVMVVATYTGSEAGKTSYLQLTFTSTTAGYYEHNSYEGGSFLSDDQGTFMWK